MFQFLAIVTAFIYILGDCLGKSWANGGGTYLLISALTIYAVGAAMFLGALRLGPLSLAVAITPVVATVGGILVGQFFFHEKLSSFQYFGVFFGFLALVMLTVPFEKIFLKS